MVCNKCGSANVQVVGETTGEIKKRSCFATLMWIILSCLTCGLVLIFPLLRSGSKGKIKTRTKFVCLNCGNEWY
jgi:hypothetical protein